MNDTRTRLAIAGRIAAGAMAHPRAYDRGNWENEISLNAWNVAGKLCRLAEQHEADLEPVAVAERAKQYAKAGG